MVALYAGVFVCLFVFFTEGVLMESLRVTARRTVSAGGTYNNNSSVCSTVKKLHGAGKARG